MKNSDYARFFIRSIRQLIAAREAVIEADYPYYTNVFAEITNILLDDTATMSNNIRELLASFIVIDQKFRDLLLEKAKMKDPYAIFLYTCVFYKKVSQFFSVSDPEQMIKFIKKCDLDLNIRRKMSSVMYMRIYFTLPLNALKSQRLELLEKALHEWEESVECLYYLGIYKFSLFKNGKNKLTKEAQEYLIDAKASLRLCIKNSFWDSRVVKDSFLLLALLDSDEELKYFKQVKYTEQRMLRPLELNVQSKPLHVGGRNVLEKKYPQLDIGLKEFCDECDHLINIMTRRKCLCYNAHYCSELCQKQHADIHNLICPLSSNLFCN